MDISHKLNKILPTYGDYKIIPTWGDYTTYACLIVLLVMITTSRPPLQTLILLCSLLLTNFKIKFIFIK